MRQGSPGFFSSFRQDVLPSMSVTQAPDGDDRHAVLAAAGTTNSLTDAATYTPVGEEDMKGAFLLGGTTCLRG